MAYVCTVCEKGTSDPRGSMKHPVCEKCWGDTDEKEYFKMLEETHFF